MGAIREWNCKLEFIGKNEWMESAGVDGSKCSAVKWMTTNSLHWRHLRLNSIAFVWNGIILICSSVNSGTFFHTNCVIFTFLLDTCPLFIFLTIIFVWPEIGREKKENKSFAALGKRWTTFRIFFPELDLKFLPFIADICSYTFSARTGQRASLGVDTYSLNSSAFLRRASLSASWLGCFFLPLFFYDGETRRSCEREHHSGHKQGRAAPLPGAAQTESVLIIRCALSQ